MKMKSASVFTVLALLALSTINSQLSTAIAQTPAGTVFTYDGQLQSGGSPVPNALYDFQFILSNAPDGSGNQVGTTISQTIGVTNGLFTTTLDFGAVFTGNATWLAISVRPTGVGNYVALSPLQELTPTPYAIFAESSSAVSGTVYANQLASIGNGIGNFFVGPAGNNTTFGLGNTALGVAALFSISGGDDNTAEGSFALDYNTSGSENTALGSIALSSNATGNDNTAIGFGTLYSAISGSYNTAVGQNALYSLGLDGEFGSPTDGGSNNIALGYDAGENITGNSSGNIYIGDRGFFGENNTIHIGDPTVQTSAYVAGIYSATPNQGSATPVYVDANGQLGTVGPSGGGGDGPLPGYVVTNNDTQPITLSTLSVSGALSASTLTLPAIVFDGNADVILSGTSPSVPLLLNDSFGNICVGLFAGHKLTTFTQPGGNTAFGVGALYQDIMAGDNTAIGYEALSNNVSGNNTAVGFLALSANKNGSGNIALGGAAGIAITGSGNIDIGNAGVASDNNIIRIGTQGTQSACYLAGNVFANGVMLTSDRNVKENFSAINAQGVLAKVASLPVTQWNYKTDDPGVQHIGPMAQDFQAAFQLSADDKHISVVDEGGVALAAIQGLNQKLESEAKDKDVQIQALKQQNDSLAERLNELETAVKQLANQK